MPTISDITAFYADIDGDQQGRLITEIWQFDQQQLESCHDYIQWLFPLEKLSQFSPQAPLLTQADLDEFHHSIIFKNNLLRSLDLMLNFYGFKREHQAITPASNFSVRVNSWLQPNSHHMKCISRILKSLRLLDMTQYSELFFTALNQLYLHRPEIIGDSFMYWQQAAGIHVK